MKLIHSVENLTRFDNNMKFKNKTFFKDYKNLKKQKTKQDKIY